MRCHEIRLYRADGTLSIIVMTSGTLIDTNALAARYLIGDIVRAEICSDRDPFNSPVRLAVAA